MIGGYTLALSATLQIASIISSRLKFRSRAIFNAAGNKSYDEEGVYVYEDGVAVAEAVPVNFADNAKIKRERSLSFRNMLKGGEDENV